MSIETENGRVKGVVTQLNGEYSAKCVVIATGTNLGGKFCGRCMVRLRPGRDARR